MNEPAANERYLRLLKGGRDLTRNAGDLPELRFALIADHATQQFTHVLKACLFERGFFPIIYEADYASAAPEAYDRQSGLHAFKPEFVYFSLAVQKYRQRFLGTTCTAQRESLPETYCAEVCGILDALTAAGYQIGVGNLALPVERMFGNFAALTPQSPYGSVVRFNALLTEAVAARKGCHLVDVMYLASLFGGAVFLDERLWASAKYMCASRFLPHIADAVVSAIAVRRGRMTKCLVLDLDNTLWGGIIGDDGVEGISLGGDAYGEAFQHFQRYLLALKQRGYVLAVCSKNNEDAAREPFKRHPEMILKEEDFAVFVANWNDKASNIEYIARVLNLGLDSFIFLDDSPFERAQVREALPQVAVPEMPEDVVDYIARIEASGLLEAMGFSHEDLGRNQLYREEAFRTTEQVRHGSIDDYLRSLGMIMDCRAFTELDLPRVAQLIQRSNQFNLRTQRFSEAICAAYLRVPDRHLTAQFKLKDKFGDYGLISAVCCDISGEELFIAELVMSCRVLKRGVEAYLMNHLVKCAKDLGLRFVGGEYIRTAKNSLVQDFLPGFGFALASDDGKSQRWRLDVNHYNPANTLIQDIPYE